MSLWTEKKYFERYEKEWYPKIEAIVKPYLVTPTNGEQPAKACEIACDCVNNRSLV